MRVLAIAPHPDDETLGCGGTLFKHKIAGDELSWLIVTKGEAGQWPAELLEKKRQEIDEVAGAYGFEQVVRLGLPAARLDVLPLEEVIHAIRGALKETRPELVYLNHRADVHSDHRVVFQAAMSAMKPFDTNAHGVKRILSYETLSSTDAMAPDCSGSFVPGVFSDITGQIEAKLELMSKYESEIQASPLPRSLDSIRALARVRGATIGVQYAEAFQLVREVISR
jgi:LmbE family N-acetylglucosaminyl deacetylase